MVTTRVAGWILVVVGFVGCYQEVRHRPPGAKHGSVQPHGSEQERVAARIDELSEGEDEPNPWELSGLYEGDMLLEPHWNSRNGVTNSTLRWPNGTVPYYVEDEDFSELLWGWGIWILGVTLLSFSG